MALGIDLSKFNSNLSCDVKDTGSIDALIKKLETVSAEINSQLDHLIERIVAFGVEREREYLQGYLHSNFTEGSAAIGKTGELYNSIRGSYDKRKKIGKITVGDHQTAMFVEFGTGLEGQMDPHPTGAPAGGFRQTKWVYYDPDLFQFFTTYGQASKPFVYNTYLDLLDMLG